MQPGILANDVADKALQFTLVTDEDQLEIPVFTKCGGSRTHDNLSTEVAAHCVK
jgi:hypothetical protein